MVLIDRITVLNDIVQRIDLRGFSPFNIPYSRSQSSNRARTTQKLKCSSVKIYTAVVDAIYLGSA